MQPLSYLEDGDIDNDKYFYISNKKMHAVDIFMHLDDSNDHVLNTIELKKVLDEFQILPEREKE